MKRSKRQLEILRSVRVPTLPCESCNIELVKKTDKTPKCSRKADNCAWEDCGNIEKIKWECHTCRLQSTCELCGYYICSVCRDGDESGQDLDNGYSYDNRVQVVPCSKCQKLRCKNNTSDSGYAEACTTYCEFCKRLLCESCCSEFAACEGCQKDWEATVSPVAPGRHVQKMCLNCYTDRPAEEKICPMHNELFSPSFPDIAEEEGYDDDEEPEY